MAVSKEFGGILASSSWVREGLEVPGPSLGAERRTAHLHVDAQQLGVLQGGPAEGPRPCCEPLCPASAPGRSPRAPGESFPAFSLHFFGGMLLSSPLLIESNRFSSF